MKFSSHFWKFRSHYCAALILALSVTIKSQVPAGNQPDAAQLEKVVESVRARKLDSAQVSAVRAVGFQLISAARYEDALSIFSAILETHPRDQQALYGGALASFNLKRLSRARALAESAVESARSESNELQTSRPARGRESDALVLLAVILAVEGDNAAALKAVRRAVEIAPDSFDAQFALGRALYGAGDLSNAAIAFRKAIMLRPEESQAIFFLATTVEAAGKYEMAREAYAELVRRQPDRAEGHLGLGVVLLKLGADKTAEGISELSQAVALNGDLYEARIALGRALIKVGRAEDAVEHLNRAALLAPNNPEPHYQLAIAYRRLGQNARAERESTKVMEINASRRGAKETSNSKLPPENRN